MNSVKDDLYKRLYKYALFWLCLLRDSGKVAQAIADPLIEETVQISKILGASVVTMRKNI